MNADRKLVFMTLIEDGREVIEKLILLAGLGQIGLALGSVYIPRALRWREELSKLRPLLRQMFWTYAGYIFCTNISFGLLSIFGAKWLSDRSPLAAAVCAFITAYWGARILIQFTYFDRKDAPKGTIYTLGEVMLILSFAFFTVVYGFSTYINIAGREK